MVMNVNAEHSLKYPFPIYPTELGIIMNFKDEQFQKQYSPSD
jgi:hypothetical protein